MGLCLYCVPLRMRIWAGLINVQIYNKMLIEHKIINLEQVNFLIFWAVTAVVFFAVGKVLGKLVGIKTLHHFGLVVVLIVLLIEIGVAHGFNMFILL